MMAININSYCLFYVFFQYPVNTAGVMMVTGRLIELSGH